MEYLESISYSNYCSSTEAGERLCLIEYEELGHDVQNQCELAGGRYIKSWYKSDCEAGNSKLVFVASDEPYCIDPSCDKDERTTLVESIMDERIRDRLESGGFYTCSFSYKRVVEFESVYENIFDHSSSTTEQNIQSLTTDLSSGRSLPTPSPVAPGVDNNIFRRAPTTNSATAPQPTSSALHHRRNRIGIAHGIGVTFSLLLLTAV
jgi:hypothetical protein